LEKGRRGGRVAARLNPLGWGGGIVGRSTTRAGGRCHTKKGKNDWGGEKNKGGPYAGKGGAKGASSILGWSPSVEGRLCERGREVDKE